MKIQYKSFNLPADLVEELKIWRQAFMISKGMTVTYGEMIRLMLDHLATDQPDVVREMEFLIERHPDLAKKIGKYRGSESEDEMYERKDQ